MEETLTQRSCDCLRIVLFGPESSGKTTLSRKLAEYYDAPWVPEFAREYLQKVWDEKGRICEPRDLLPIAKGQMQLENSASERADKLLICDTNLLQTKVYSEAYFNGWCDPLLEKHAGNHQYDLYLLTYIDVPWEADDLRDKPEERNEMYMHFKNALDYYNLPYIVIKGSVQDRLETAINHINKLLILEFTEQELQEIKAHGLTPDQVRSQVDLFRNGVPKVKLAAPATTEEGIFQLSEQEEMEFMSLYENKRKDLELLKFIPASGAATRMFKKIYQFLEEYDPGKETIDAFIQRTDDAEMRRFFSGYKKFPFYYRVMDEVEKRYKEEELSTENEKKLAFVRTLMGKDALNYGDLPKGLIPFHNYESHRVTAFEEHLVEAAEYASESDKARLHFTVSPEHRNAFEKHFDEIRSSVSNAAGVNFHVNYSFQKPETDTVAVTPNNQLYRKPDGKLLFRPGGHGALIENLNDVDADLIFIKNIDNVLVQDKIQTLARHKKILAGLMLDRQKKVFEYAKMLDENEISESSLEELEDFLKNEFSTRLDTEYESFSLSEKKKYLYQLLDRPLRVCGMVKNEGEPGGGPFWVTDEKGKTALQIIESAQVDKQDPTQKKIFKESTHFNPVDLVCGVRNYKGEKYNLLNYVNPDLAFIASKTDSGNPIKALELPGLWNGAMARWNTIFVEVPLETFNPVKTVSDLLKPQHQVG